MSLVLASPALAQDTAAKTEKAANIERLLKLMGADKLQSGLLDQMLEILTPMFSANGQGDEATRKMLSRFSDIMTEEFHKADFSGIAPALYDKYFSNDEIKGLIAFYESPLGQKTIQVLPSLMSESVSRGQKLGEQVGQRAIQRLIDEFPVLKNDLQEQPPKKL
jgi:hypothetical protein